MTTRPDPPRTTAQPAVTESQSAYHRQAGRNTIDTDPDKPTPAADIKDTHPQTTQAPDRARPMPPAQDN